MSALRTSQLELLRALLRAGGQATDAALAEAAGVAVSDMRRQLASLAGSGLLAVSGRGAVWVAQLTHAGAAALSAHQRERGPVRRRAWHMEQRRLPVSARLDRLHELALKHMYRVDAGTPERRVREARAVALALAWAAAVKHEEEGKWVA